MRKKIAIFLIFLIIGFIPLLNSLILLSTNNPKTPDFYHYESMMVVTIGNKSFWVARIFEPYNISLNGNDVQIIFVYGNFSQFFAHGLFWPNYEGCLVYTKNATIISSIEKEFCVDLEKFGADLYYGYVPKWFVHSKISHLINVTSGLFSLLNKTVTYENSFIGLEIQNESKAIFFGGFFEHSSGYFELSSLCDDSIVYPSNSSGNLNITLVFPFQNITSCENATVTAPYTLETIVPPGSQIPQIKVTYTDDLTEPNIIVTRYVNRTVFNETYNVINTILEIRNVGDGIAKNLTIYDPLNNTSRFELDLAFPVTIAELPPNTSQNISYNITIMQTNKRFITLPSVNLTYFDYDLNNIYASYSNEITLYNATYIVNSTLKEDPLGFPAVIVRFFLLHPSFMLTNLTMDIINLGKDAVNVSFSLERIGELYGANENISLVNNSIYVIDKTILPQRSEQINVSGIFKPTLYDLVDAHVNVSLNINGTYNFYDYNFSSSSASLAISFGPQYDISLPFDMFWNINRALSPPLVEVKINSTTEARGIFYQPLYTATSNLTSVEGLYVENFTINASTCFIKNYTISARNFIAPSAYIEWNRSFLFIPLSSILNLTIPPYIYLPFASLRPSITVDIKAPINATLGEVVNITIFVKNGINSIIENVSAKIEISDMYGKIIENITYVPFINPSENISIFSGIILDINRLSDITIAVTVNVSYANVSYDYASIHSIKVNKPPYQPPPNIWIYWLIFSIVFGVISVILWIRRGR